MKRLLVLFAFAACGDQIKIQDGVTCKGDADCKVGSVSGTCESTGFCAYPDDACADGVRYSPGATGMENECVGGAGCGLTDGAACCAGSTCAANLVCNAASTCACGANNEPCCDGSTCDTGTSCVQGTCKSGIEQVTMSYRSVCVLRTDKVVQCWGSDARRYSRTGAGAAFTITPPGDIAITDVADLKRGDVTACVRKTDGTVWCWGHNEHGELGNGTTTSSATPVQVSGLTAVTQLAVGRMHTCVVGTVASVIGIYCWGRGGSDGNSNESRLGPGDGMDHSAPVAVDMSQMAATGQTVRAIAAGGYHSCAIMSDNRAWCWGKNDQGGLGDNTTNVSKVPVLVDLSQITIPNGVQLVEVVVGVKRNGYGTTGMRLSDGTVYVWGSVEGGEAGDGTITMRQRPTVPVTTTALAGATFTSIVATSQGICALASDKTVWCWGSRFVGATGDNDPDGGSATSPVQVQGLPATITAIAGGHRAACAIDGAKRLWCWGNNRTGQLTRVTPTTNESARLPIASDVTP